MVYSVTPKLEKEVAKLAKVGEAKRPRVFIDRNKKKPRAWPDEKNNDV
jgi:hypothetical protein